MEHRPAGPYVYQPYGCFSDPERAASSRLHGVCGVDFGAEITGLTHPEAIAVAGVLRALWLLKKSERPYTMNLPGAELCITIGEGISWQPKSRGLDDVRDALKSALTRGSRHATVIALGLAGLPRDRRTCPELPCKVRRPKRAYG